MQILIAVLTAWFAQDPTPTPAAPRIKIDFKLIIDPGGGAWRFKVEGTADLPDGTILEGRIIVSEKVVDFRGGTRTDDEPLGTQKTFEVKDGRFCEVLHSAPRKPYSLRYSAKLTYRPDGQPEGVADKVDSPEASASVSIGTFDDPGLERELAETKMDLAIEMERIFGIHRGLKKRIAEWIKVHDAGAYDEYKKALERSLDEIRLKNDERYHLWAVWLELQARFKVEGFVDRFDRTLKLYEEWRQTRDVETLQAIDRVLNGFMANFEEAREAMGLDTPVDREAVVALLRDYESAVSSLAAVDAASWKGKAPPLRDQARAALLTMVARKLVPRRIYERVVALSQAFLSMYRLQGSASSDARELEAARAAHGRTLGDFKQYAGIK